MHQHDSLKKKGITKP